MKKSLILAFCSISFLSQAQSLDFQLKKNQTFPFYSKDLSKSIDSIYLIDSTTHVFSSNMPVKIVEGVMPNVAVKSNHLMPNAILNKRKEGSF